MKRLQLQRWSNSVLSRARTGSRLQQQFYSSQRYQSTTSSPLQPENNQLAIEEQSFASPIAQPSFQNPKHRLPSPPVQAHATRSLVDASADPDPSFNNESLATLGHDLLSHYTSEHLICTYPRLPLTVIFAAMYAYVGPKTLAAMAREWGVEQAASPGGEVDPGYLQFKRYAPGADVNAEPLVGAARPYEEQKTWRKSITSSIVYDNEFGDPALEGVAPHAIPDVKDATPATAEQASATFVRAVMGAIYLHAGRPAAKRFFEQHILSRHLDISGLFNFSQPARDLSRLCARENYEPPVARIISETGRKSRHPVFVVGIYSGQDKLGEGAGASLLEARSRAAVAALKGWYLYSPLDVRVPSSMEEEGAAPWKPVHVDLGEVIV
ncbi:mitochondrial 54S ribosomal protein [Aspergillus rambellii]|uniref:Large ribosomal subunit protein mL44 n=2 Tax=Aspergillus subgen. Nidulantes TaxID=2720870 RepID=A0A0F8UM28_9EURO|nr:mitochondrial 54S ribosomal protein [Aspergillus ochraceoroseus]KKK20578.1 mitochondrial 54S ribosomal protein [Aspergillus rambellii]